MIVYTTHNASSGMSRKIVSWTMEEGVVAGGKGRGEEKMRFTVRTTDSACLDPRRVVTLIVWLPFIQ